MISDFSWDNLQFLIEATRWTIGLSLLVFITGGIAGFAVALLRTARSPFLRFISALYIQLVQGTPVLDVKVRLIYFYYCFISVWRCATYGGVLRAVACYIQMQCKFYAVTRLQEKFWYLHNILCTHCGFLPCIISDPILISKHTTTP